jgi:hypothetical protein
MESYIAYIGFVTKDLRDLNGWEHDLRLQVEDLQKRRAGLELELQRASKKLELVRQIRLLEQDPTKSQSFESAERKEMRSTPTAVREMAQRILSDSTGPLHISEIHRLFKEQGYPIPGSGTPFNILAHLVNDKTFVRVARGTYALAGTVPEEAILVKAQRKTRRKKRQKKSTASVHGEEI